MGRSVFRDRLRAITDYHQPVKPGEPRTPCRACESHWWPCMTYKIATGVLADENLPVPVEEPFGHVVTSRSSRL